jgi:predicted HNH restriction endonuclease
MFVIATRQSELYLLGAIDVSRSGDDWAEGSSLCGAFRIIPLKGLKWRLRFEGTSSPRLTKDDSLAWQVRARRRLSAESASLLLKVLSAKLKRTKHEVTVREGKTTQVALSKRERSKVLRVQALAQRGTVCEICEFDFAKQYGDFARNCVEVHHIEALAGAGHRGVMNTLDDVIVICPNCHRALHQFKNPDNWKAFRKLVLSRTI